MTTIGLIGLGHMGNPMAHRLLEAGFTLFIYDVKKEIMQALIQEGAIEGQSVSELADNADIMITMVQTGQQVKELCCSEIGIFKHVRPNTLYIDCSSIDLKHTLLLHEEAKKHNVAMLDAPVSGGVPGAKEGTLTFMVGGADKDFARAQPILQAMGKKIIHAGPAGRGQVAKICNNLLLGISMIGVSEAFTLADKLGLAPKKFFEIASNASGQCWSMTSYCPVPGILENVPANNQYKPGFMAKMMLKDLLLGQQAAASVNAVIPLGAVATELYQLYVNQGCGEIDFSGIINMIAEKI